MDEENVKMQKIVRLHVDMAYFFFFVLVMHSQKIISIFLFLFFIKKKYSTKNILQETFQNVSMEKRATSKMFSDIFFDF